MFLKVIPAICPRTRQSNSNRILERVVEGCGPLAIRLRTAATLLDSEGAVCDAGFRMNRQLEAIGPMSEVIEWSEERAERARELFLSGYSGSQVAAELGGGLTRNAVMGKLARMGVKRPRRTARPEQVLKVPPAPRPLPRPIRMEPDSQPLSAPVIECVSGPVGENGVVRAVQTARSNMCMAPIGDPESEDFRFCGQSCEGSYCSFHASRFLQAPRRRRMGRSGPHRGEV